MIRFSDSDEDEQIEKLVKTFDGVVVQKHQSWQYSGPKTLGLKDFLCRKCDDVIQEPKIMACCNRAFCQECLTPENRYHHDTYNLHLTEKCPVCQPSKPTPYHEPSKFYLKTLKSLKVKCRDKACQQTVSYSDIKEHLKKNCLGWARCDCCAAEYQICEGHGCVRSIRKDVEKAKEYLKKQQIKIDALDERLPRIW
ncbi:Oidioi.mRNA.OKI2018_I69.XSR.g14261.t1.cds [Oikopleura dioica]|uniref:Oidioi.mRNA.OKI2018_I69.XSR.g14261.t1.cds n=1 Tax=Oikopleura dioica TaxID=34765 RepID=A0ABN7SI34_OIKDI|nr:Oidioi.mRNA.OKI2018_I69.XSR.g14261.t1.cds [Oikopleura dioica]